MWIKRHWLAGGLGVSLLVNFFFIAVAIGYFFVSSGNLLHRSGWPLVSSERVAALPKDEKQRYLDAMQRHHMEIEAARHAAQTARKATEADMVMPVFDRSGVSADLAGMRQATFHFQETVHAALVDALAELSLQSRAKLVAQNTRMPNVCSKGD
jgi:uncharacterized membrane protein